MRGIADDLRATAAHVRRGDCSSSYASDQVDRGDAWLAGARGRRDSRGGLAEEIAEVEEDLAALREVVRQVFGGRDAIRLLYVPERLSKTQTVMGRAETFANLSAMEHARRRGVSPRKLIDAGSLLEAERVKLPSVEVLRYDQGWVVRRGRARVEVAYELLIRGVHVLFGSKRYVMRQADWAVKCDAFGKLPEIETLTGLAKRRALYKRRKAKRFRGRVRVMWRETQRVLRSADANRKPSRFLSVPDVGHGQWR